MNRRLGSAATALIIGLSLSLSLSLAGCGATASTEFNDACDKLLDASFALPRNDPDYDQFMSAASDHLEAALEKSDNFEHADAVRYALEGLPQTLADMAALDDEHKMMTAIQFGSIQQECDDAGGS